MLVSFLVFCFILYAIILDVDLPTHLCFIMQILDSRIVVLRLHYLLFTNSFDLLKFTENSKKRKVHYKCSSLFPFVLWYEWNNPCVYSFFTSMHVLNFVFWICVLCLIFKMIIWLDFIISWSPEKRFRGNFGSILDFLGIPN